mmetsp:Transcript_14466/g.22318  ORF Transcript_14466/g.22318 Transcript_14466/m.22318 type:complete len:204 (+) Transcript_14466:1149-1760(+)
MQLPFAPISYGIIYKYCDRYSSRSCKMHPDSHVNMPLVESNEITSSSFAIDRIISLEMGILPPTKPVLPDCGTIGNRFKLQYSNIFETSYVDLGWIKTSELPLYCLIQSRLYAPIAVMSVITFPPSDSKPRKDSTCNAGSLYPLEEKALMRYLPKPKFPQSTKLENFRVLLHSITLCAVLWTYRTDIIPDGVQTEIEEYTRPK